MKKPVHATPLLFLIAVLLIFSQNSYSQATNRLAKGKPIINVSKPKTDYKIKQVLVCQEGSVPVSLSDTIRFIYNSYIHFKWQKSNTGGTRWNDMSGPGTSGIGTPSLVKGKYHFVTTLPAMLVSGADSGTYYRVMMANTASEVNNIAAYKTQGTFMISAVNCENVLQGNFKQFKGAIIDKKSFLSWSTTEEKNLSHYEIEKSRDGITFVSLARVEAKNSIATQYNYTNPIDLNSISYYRLKMVQANKLFKYSSIVLVSPSQTFEISNVKNPFSEKIEATVSLPESGNVQIFLFNESGMQVRSIVKKLNKGINKLVIEDWGNLSNGLYYITLEYKNKIDKRKLIRQ